MSEETGASNKVRYRVDIYIGSDNGTRKINDSYSERVSRWANETFPGGYTYLRGKGYYNGVSEDSILLHAFLNYDPALKQQLEKLKRELKQDAIILVKSAVDYEMI